MTFWFIDELHLCMSTYCGCEKAITSKPYVKAGLIEKAVGGAGGFSFCAHMSAGSSVPTASHSTQEVQYPLHGAPWFARLDLLLMILCQVGRDGVPSVWRRARH